MSRNTNQLKRLTATQAERINEITLMHTRIRERPAESITQGIIRSRLEALEAIWKGAHVTHTEIIGRDDVEADPYIVDKVFATLQVTYEDALDEFLRLQSRFESAGSGSLATVPTGEALTAAQQTRLPKINLPTFSGAYEDWSSFRDGFVNLVHNLTYLANFTKLQYLKSCLTGKAADLVKDVETTDANYLPTWNALNSRYNNPRFIVNKHLHALMSIEAVNRESAESLQSFADESSRIIRALTSLHMPVEHWDIWLVYLLSSRLGSETRKLWEAELSEKDRAFVSRNSGNAAGTNPLDRFPKLSDFLEFLEKRAQTLANMSHNPQNLEKRVDAEKRKFNSSRKVHFAQRSNPYERPKCPCCSNPHPLFKCLKFKAKPLSERRDDIRRWQLCFNCFGRHKFNACSSLGRCLSCKGKHHSLLHVEKSKGSSEGSATDQSGGHTRNSVSVNTANTSPFKGHVILATAKVTVIGSRGQRTQVRALLDQGAESTFISEAIVQLLGMPRQHVHVNLTGVGATPAGTVRFMTSLTLVSEINPNFQIQTNALILPRLTSQLPSTTVEGFDLNQLTGLTLADPRFFKRDTIDLIIGADLYGQLLQPGLRRVTSGLVAQNTALGWIVSGTIFESGARRAEFCPQTPVASFHASTCTEEENLSNLLQRFWTLEEVSESQERMPEDEACEDRFCKTHARDSTGRYVVRLPLKSATPEVGESSRRIALASLFHQYRRFARDPRVGTAYTEFMQTYEKLGHMTRVPNSELKNPHAWYIPHHAVITESPSKWKIRVVFDASRKTPDGHCLNDFLLPGPALQKDLSLILLNWRQYRFVFTADIVKMFRQIRVASEDQDLQRIVWSPVPTQAPVEYKLTTVTYGTACAPYLAIRTLTQLAKDEQVRFPLGSQCIEQNTYVDDIFAGSHEIASTIRIREELVNILRTAGIELDKWAANDPKILPPSVHSSAEAISVETDSSVKTLGIHWSPTDDKFSFDAIKLDSLFCATTKRALLSNISRLFDPLGWLAPVTVTAKILMQDLWILKCDWDAPLPSSIRDRWLEYCNSLRALPNLSIERWVGTSEGQRLELHGFSDASTRAYAAVVYLRICNDQGRSRVSLLAAKTKVAPVKTVSIPNLELCGAVLLVRLIRHIENIEFLQNLKTFTWTDSQVTLSWIRKHPRFWKTFVANRVSYIQTELPNSTWGHVPSKENPADLASRGLTPNCLKLSELWWQGPTWLSKSENNWPQPRETAVHTQRAQKNHLADPEILTRFSSLSRLLRVVAYCRRFILLVRYRRKTDKMKLSPFLASEELLAARHAVIRLAQKQFFAFELETLAAKKDLPKRKEIRKLNPFLDEEAGLLRVGGRLAYSQLPLEVKHPPILPHQSVLSKLFVRHAHHKCLHGGPTLTTSVLMQQVWILGGRRLVKTCVRKCITCQRKRPLLAKQLMGNLPADRVTPTRPFSISGLDYAGPIQVRTTKGRGHRAYKGYICLFVCFVTRAIHLEVVSDLTSAGFLAAYRRFTGRRGICHKLYSDNASTFKGADRELQEMWKSASTFYNEVSTVLANDGTQWKFIPPTTPHYGGLWEAGVKSTKHHLRRVIGEHTLTYEELATILVEIEASLNSRPLSPLTSDMEDLQVLTPAHFLIGVPSALIPDSDPPAVPENRLSRYQLLQRIRNNFWKRWSKEYLLYLQEREKWRDVRTNYAIGQLVLLHEDNYPPSKWPLGRIVKVHPGPDELVRVVTVKTSTNQLDRHIARLSPLLMEETKEENPQTKAKQK